MLPPKRPNRASPSVFVEGEVFATYWGRTSSPETELVYNEPIKCQRLVCTVVDLDRGALH